MLNMLAIWKPKPILREEAKIAWVASNETSVNEKMPVFTDDDLVTYVTDRDGLEFEQYHIDLKPDFIIDNLRDLLAIF